MSRARPILVDGGFAAASVVGLWWLTTALVSDEASAPLLPGWRITALGGIAVLVPYLAVLGARMRRGAATELWGRLRTLFAALVATWLAYLLSGQHPHPHHTGLIAGTAMAAAAGLHQLTLAWPCFRRSRARRTLGAVAAAAAAVVLGLELGLRGAARVVDSPFLVRGDAGSEELLRRFRYPPGRVRFGFPCNAGGHYDEPFLAKQAGTPLVAVIGDSFSTGIVPHHYHYTTALERLLPPLRVCNLGMPAIGPREYLHLLHTEALPLRPDLVIISTFVGNDLHQSLPRERSVPPWLVRDDVAMVTALSRLTRMWRERLRLGRHDLGIVGETTMGRADLPAVLREFPWFLDPLLEPPTHSAIELLRIERSCARWILQPPHHVHYDEYFAILDRIVAAAHPTPVLVSIIPFAVQVDDWLWATLVARRPGDGYQRGRPQTLLRAGFEQRGLPYVDLLPSLRSVATWSDGSRHLYKLGDTHFNVRGNLRAAAALAGPVAERLRLASRPRCSGRTIDIEIDPARTATASGMLAVWLPAHCDARATVEAGDGGARIAERLAAAIADWGIPAECPRPGTVRLDGSVHYPPLVGVIGQLAAPGLEMALTVPLGEPWPDPPELLLAAQQRPAQVRVELLAADGAILAQQTVATPHEIAPALARRVPALDTDVREAEPVAIAVPRAATHLRVRGRDHGVLFLDVPSTSISDSLRRGYAAPGRDPPRLEVRRDGGGRPIALVLQCDHPGAHALLLLGSRSRWLPLDAFRPGAVLAIDPGDALRVRLRADGSGRATVALPPCSGIAHVQAVLVPDGGGFADLELTPHLVLRAE